MTAAQKQRVKPYNTVPQKRAYNARMKRRETWMPKLQEAMWKKKNYTRLFK